MPLLPLTDKQAGKAKRKKKTAKDPDAEHVQYLDSIFYSPKNLRALVYDNHRTAITEAILAFTEAAPDESLHIGDEAAVPEQADLPLNEYLPVAALPQIVRAAKLNPTSKQLAQIEDLVTLIPGSENEDLAAAANKVVKRKKRTVKRSPARDGAAGGIAKEGDGKKGGKHLKKKRVKSPQEAPVAVPSEFSRPDHRPVRMIGRKKLEELLLQVLKTKLLVYDPQSVPTRSPQFSERATSVVYNDDQYVLRNCFRALWESSGQGYAAADLESEAPVRCINAQTLREQLAKGAAAGEDNLSAAELDQLFLSIQEADSDVIREDIFVLAAEHM